MKDTVIDLNVLELNDGENPFDQLASKLEALNLNGLNAEKYHALENQLLALEREYLDLQDKDSDKAAVIIQAMKVNLLLVEGNYINSVEEMEKSLDSIKIVTDNLIHSSVNNTSSFIKEVLSKRLERNSKITLEDLYATLINKMTLSQSEKKPNETLAWQIELNFKTATSENHKPLDFIHTFIESINTIPGINVILEDIRIGSIHAKLKVEFENEASKDALKDVLEQSTELVMVDKNDDTPSASTNNLDQIQDSKLIDEPENYTPTDPEENKLRLELLKAEVERKKLENKLLEIQVMKERKSFVTTILSDGMLNQNELALIINGIPFLKIENGRVVARTDIGLIDS